MGSQYLLITSLSTMLKKLNKRCSERHPRKLWWSNKGSKSSLTKYLGCPRAGPETRTTLKRNLCHLTWGLSIDTVRALLEKIIPRADLFWNLSQTRDCKLNRSFKICTGMISHRNFLGLNAFKWRSLWESQLKWSYSNNKNFITSTLKVSLLQFRQSNLKIPKEQPLFTKVTNWRRPSTISKRWASRHGTFKIQSKTLNTCHLNLRAFCQLTRKLLKKANQRSSWVPISTNSSSKESCLLHLEALGSLWELNSPKGLVTLVSRTIWATCLCLSIQI